MPSNTRIRQGIAARADLAGNFLLLPAGLNLAMNLYCSPAPKQGDVLKRNHLQIPRRLPEKFV